LAAAPEKGFFVGLVMRIVPFSSMTVRPAGYAGYDQYARCAGDEVRATAYATIATGS
jgi:hypothetical protein